MGKLSTVSMFLRRRQRLEEPTDLYGHRVKLLDGGELDLAQWRGQPALIVNTASKCGLTPQYQGLQELYERYHDRGLNVLGSPSGDFADQEYDEAGEIRGFCQRNYGVQFPLTERTSVRRDPGPFWAELISQPNSAPPMWNFTKYLVGADGHLIEHFGPTVRPDSEQVRAAIERALADAVRTAAVPGGGQ
ncbi:MAG: glutathione peroxidase [Actinomycetota bacterium]|nr:glutathione peroxidase [Actinomycetota bacterium]